MHVVATAGHVDHGKSTLVEALTGTDPDRFAEEKARGLTIDLGFAWLSLPSGREVSIVDVPGHERFIRNMLAGGAVVAGGSDAPVEVGSPLIEFYAAVARQDLDGNAGEGWHPEQALSRDQALALFTSAAAFAAFQEDDLGTIEVGKIADFSVFDRDLMTIPAAEILDAQARMTIIGGEIVWQAAE